MKIAIFTNNYLPNPYGVTGSIESFRKELEKRGHTVYVFAPEFKGYKDENPNVFRYPSIDVEIKFRFPLAVPYSRKMGKILKKLDIDIIHSQHPNLLGSAAARWAKKLARGRGPVPYGSGRGGKKIPLVFTWHTLYDQYAHFAKFVPKKIAAWWMINGAVRYANRADAVVVPTDSIIPILKSWGVKNENIVPIATGVEEEDFSGADGDIIRKKYGITDGELVLLLISRLTSEKNIKFVFRSVEKVLKVNDKIKFLVSGGGYLVPELEKFAKQKNLEDRIIVTGVVKREELKDYYAAGDIFVYGSKSETQGMVISEAMYAGLPIVAVDATGVKSLVVNNANGFLVREDEKEFSEAVSKLAGDEKLRRKFGENSKRIAESQFTSGVSADKLLEVYESLISV